MPQERLAHHILTHSATMIGVCVTAVGLVKIAESHIGPSQVDIYFSLTALNFAGSALLAYLAIRIPDPAQGSTILERMADALFIIGLLGAILVATLFAYEVI